MENKRPQTKAPNGQQKQQPFGKNPQSQQQPGKAPAQQKKPGSNNW